MNRCIQLAKNGLGSTRPNPMVGCVIVLNNKIIGEGYTSPYGGNHAEVNAINSVLDKSLLNTATIYVSLEPCSHFGKTPPCADLILKHNIPKVIIGVVDDNVLVGGKGVERLKSKGVEVLVGVLENECKEVNKRFFAFHNKKRPYIILKWAETKDGFIDINRENDSKKEPNWISNENSQQLVHKWRSEEQSILVGTNTVIFDNPKLNVRKWIGENPIRLILDSSFRIDKKANVFDNSIKTIVFTNSKISIAEEKENVKIAVIDFSKNVPTQICTYLYENEIQSVIIEGGAKILQSFINDKLWDEARIFIGSNYFRDGLMAPIIKGKTVVSENIMSDTLNLVIPI